jgi:hypothetical protein
MDLHPSGGPVRSVKDFFAKIAVAGFRKELAYNEDEVKYVLTRVPELQGKIEKAISTLSAAPVPPQAERLYLGRRGV